MKYMHNYIAGIDLGSQSINVALASHNDDNISYKYLGRVNSGGIEKGQVTDLNLLSNSIKTCINSINETYDVNNIDWSVGINNQNVKWSLVSGTSYIKNGYGLITESDINDTLLTCQENAARDNEKIIYMCPVKYYVDGICQLKQPIGKTAEELKIDAICFSIKSDEFFNIKNALMLSGIKKFKLSISSFELNNLVLNDSTLSKNVLMIDVGAELTNVFQFDNNNLIYMDTIPIGGQSITSDLSICGKIDLNTADEIKMLYSSRYRTLYKQKLIGEKLKEAIT